MQVSQPRLDIRKKNELNKDRLESRVTKVFAFDDPVTIGFPGARALVRTYRKTWRMKDGKPVGEPTKDVAYHLSSLDPYERKAEEFARFVRSHWGVETYHGKRDNAYLEDKTARRINPQLQTAMMLARSIGLWAAARCPEKTVCEVQADLYLKPRKAVHLFTKRGML